MYEDKRVRSAACAGCNNSSDQTQQQLELSGSMAAGADGFDP